MISTKFKGIEKNKRCTCCTLKRRTYKVAVGDDKQGVIVNNLCYHCMELVSISLQETLKLAAVYEFPKKKKRKPIGKKRRRKRI